jgi:XRE family aerobic/anaerobic benzoate catabolism transcriptional regulator
VRQLALHTALSPRFLGALESGRANISVRNLASVAAALDTSASKLLADDEPRALPPVIALLGMRGAGKTSVGQRLARRFKVPFIELDHRVEEGAGLKLAEIFALHGEPYYRQLQRHALEAVLRQGRRCVLAVGGGLVTDAVMWTRLRSQAFTIWLRAEPHDYMKRVLAQGDRRPMAGRPDAIYELRRLLREREPLYAQAHVTIDTSRTALAATVKAALEALS